LRCLRPSVGTIEWGRRIKKNPGTKNNNNADRQRFRGGFVKTDPPFDYPGSPKLPPDHVQFVLKSLKSLFLRTASTDLHA
jgi:hypothetical protein